MIYRRMYEETKREEFLNIYNYWIEQTLKFSSFNDGLAGYKCYTPNGWINDSSVLMGMSGIGLVLLSYLQKEDQNWDEMLLLS